MAYKIIDYSQKNHFFLLIRYSCQYMHAYILFAHPYLNPMGEDMALHACMCIDKKISTPVLMPNKAD